MVQCVGAVERDLVINRVKSSIIKSFIFHLLTDFLGILIHSTWFYALV